MRCRRATFPRASGAFRRSARHRERAVSGTTPISQRIQKKARKLAFQKSGLHHVETMWFPQGWFVPVSAWEIRNLETATWNGFRRARLIRWVAHTS